MLRSQDVYWIWLQLMFGIGTARAHCMTESFPVPEEFYQLLSSKALATDTLAKREWSNVETALEQAKRLEDKMLKNHCHVITPDHEEYPEWLRFLYAKPLALYVKGDLSCLNSSLPITMVGGRKTDEYGIRIAKKLSAELASCGAVIISGLANGIDQICLEQAVDSGSSGIGVLACGLDIDYPQGSADIKRKLCSHGGAVLTEYPFGAKPIASRFPVRNRVMAGMSRGVVVVQAGANSGSLITARHAVEAGREVFAVPGSIFSEYQEGCHDLIRQGEAKLVSCVEDILSEYPEIVNTPLEGTYIPDTPPNVKKPLPEDCDEVCKIIYEVITEDKITPDQICLQTELPIAEVLSGLTILEIMGLISSYPGGRFSLSTHS